MWRITMQKKKTAFIIVLSLLCSVGVFAGLTAAIWNLAGMKIEVQLRGAENYQLEYGEEYNDPGAKAVLRGESFLKKGFLLPVSADYAGVKTQKLGTYKVIYSASFLWTAESQRRTVTVVDTTPPEIELRSDPDYYTLPGHAYEEEGYTAKDAHDGDLTDAVTSYEEDGVVYYSVTDSSGNTATAQRTIYYDDKSIPVITLVGDAIVTIEKGTDYVDEGCYASDDCDGDITSKVSAVWEGNQIIYTVTDSSGNTATATRTINVTDTLAPVMTMNGDSEMYISAGKTFTDPGVTALDQGDGDLTDAVEVSGSVDVYHAGEYTLTYTSTDQAGNSTSLQRLVHVEPVAQPDVVTPSGKVVYLTFDDGPGQYTDELLDLLGTYNVKATFFVTNGYPAYAGCIGKAYRAGHSIGVHTYTHNYNDIYASEEAYFADFEKMEAVIEEQTGSRTTLMRFPGGSSNMVSSFNSGVMTRLTEAVEDMGYQYFDWNVSSGDAGETTDTEVVAQNVIAGMQSHDVSVVLQHDIKGYSVAAVEQIITWGIENGYTFLPLTETSPGAHHNVQN